MAGKLKGLIPVYVAILESVVNFYLVQHQVALFIVELKDSRFLLLHA